MVVIILSGAWLAGIFLGSKLHLPLLFILAGLLPLPMLFLFRRHRRSIILASLGLIAFCSAATYSYQSLNTVTEQDISFYRDRGAVEVHGMVSQDPETTERSTHIYLSADQIKVKDSWQEVEGTVLLFVPMFSEYRYGDVLQVSGELETPPQFADFDYLGYLAGKGIYTTMLYPEVEIVAREQGSPVMSWIYTARNRLAQTLSRVLPEPQASLAQGIILGIRGNIPLSVRENFVRTGTAHLLAISGLHLGIMAGIVLSLGLWLFGRRRYLYVWLALAAVWLYALLTGMNPPVVRGAIMASLFLAAELLGRQRSAIIALTFAAAVMVGISPYLLVNAAFQLSFLAMAGLAFLFPAFRSVGRKAVSAVAGESETLAAALTMASDSLSVTMAAVVVVWPVVAYYFGVVSLVGLLATFLALPALPPIIIIGVLTAALGLVFLPAAQVVGWLLWLPLSYLLLVVSGLAAPPLAFLEVGSLSPAWLWLYYSLLAAAILLLQRKPGRAMAVIASAVKSGANQSIGLISRLPVKLAIPLLSTVAVLVWAAVITLPDDYLHVSFLDVGQGDAILIQQGNQQVLIDGGPSPQAINLELGKRLPFWDRTIELVVLTHPNQDHLAGLVTVLQNFEVKQVLYPDLKYASPLYDQWRDLIQQKGIKQVTARAGQRIELGGDTVIAVLNPPEVPLEGTNSDIDNNGVVLRLTSGELSFLLTADIRQEAELQLIADRAQVSSTLLKVAHHGSDTSTGAEFLSVVAPQLAVISVGADNPYGHPDDQVLRRLGNNIAPEYLFRTDRQGTVEFTTDGERLWVEREN